MTVGGNVQSDGAVFIRISGSDIGGNVQVKGTEAGDSYICSTDIAGDLQLDGNGVSFLIGTNGVPDHPCETEAGNDVGGNLQAHENADVDIFDNDVGGNLQCKGNTVIDGSNNSVDGNYEDQCEEFD